MVNERRLASKTLLQRQGNFSCNLSCNFGATQLQKKMGGVTTPEKNNSRSVGKHVEGTTKTPVKAILTNYTALYFYN